MAPNGRCLLPDSGGAVIICHFFCGCHRPGPRPARPQTENSHSSLTVTLCLPAIICQLTPETSSKALIFSDDRDVIWVHLIKSLFFEYYADFCMCDFVSEIPLLRYEIQSSGAEVFAISSASKCPSTCQPLSSFWFNTFLKCGCIPKRVVKAHNEQKHLMFQKEREV